MSAISDAYILVQKAQERLDELFRQQALVQAEVTAATARLQSINQQIGDATVEAAQARAELKKVL